MARIPTDNNLMSPIGDLTTCVAIGAIPGWTAFRKFGMNDAVPVGTSEMWPAGVLRTLPTSGGQLSVVSDSAEDGAGTLTGALTIIVEGLDSDYEEISETITMNGLTPVLSVGTDWFRVNRAYNVTAGSNEINVGNITISIGGNVQAFIELNQGQTHQTHYTVPANKQLIIRQYRMNVGRMAGNTDLHILGQVLLPDHTAWRTLSDIWLWNGANWSNDQGATVLPPQTELRQRIISTVATQCSAIVAGHLVDLNKQGNFGG